MKTRSSKPVPKHPNDGSLSKKFVCIDAVQPSNTGASATSQPNVEKLVDSLPGDVDEGHQRRFRCRKEQFDALHQEMELVSYGVSETGQARRKFPRHLSVERTKKRRLLELQDRESVDIEQSKTIGFIRTRRGSKAASDDVVLHDSLIYGPKPSLSDVDRAEESDSAQGEDELGTPTDPDEVDDFVQVDDDDAFLEIDDLDHFETTETMQNCSDSKKPSSTKFTKPKSGKISRVQRLRNFKSTRMAEKHGAALGAHIQGRPALAIRRLKNVATVAPSAPQIYSTLGMVYEDLLQESQRKYATTETSLVDDEMKMAQQIDSNPKRLRVDSKLGLSIDDRASSRDEGFSDFQSQVAQVQVSVVHDNALLEQLNLAKKAYGSYHVAAILCKRDYSLWLRAADTAYEIALLHTAIMKLPDIPKTVLEYHRGEKLRWLDDAKNDYQTAGGLNPPGIEIPAKLAHIMIELGMLSEALTILTGLKKHANFATSYRAWLLFADLMLRIGHECNQWNRGIQTNSNYMFRRWLRKLAASFDWKERRLQVLVKALEAACGSESCRGLISWISHRVKQVIVPPNDIHDCMQLEDSLQNISVVNEEGVLDDCFTPPEPVERFPEVVQPLSASCRVVFCIASELMRHMIYMDLWDGGLYVGESVSLYLKSRQEMSDLRSKKKSKFDASKQKPTSIFAMQPESYDAIDNGMKNDADSANDAPLSDDEDWDNCCDDTDIVRPMRKGVLPPEIKFLYGLCLAGQGEKLFLAITCIESVGYLPMESCSFLEERVVDFGVYQDSDWIVYHEMMTQPYGRLAALALVFDVLSQKNLEKTIAALLVPLFQRQLLSFTKNRLIEGALDFNGNANIVRNHRRNHIAKVLLASVRYELFQMEYTTLEPRDRDQKQRFVDTRFEEWIDALFKVVEIAWKIEPDETLDEFCLCMVDVLARLLKIYNDILFDCGTLQDTAKLDGSLSRVLQVVAVISGESYISFTEKADATSPDLSSFPLTSTWLSSDLEALAKRAFNLCVGLNVTHFSGWEMDSFSLRLLSGKSIRDFLGITFNDGPIAGFLLPTVEEELVAQWEFVRKRYAKPVSFSFHDKLLHLRESKWYAETRGKYIAERENLSVIKLSARHGLSALLGVSRLCLLLDHKTNVKSFLVALSILLPISQFCLRESLWDSKIGQHDDKGSNDTGEWLEFSSRTLDHHVAPSNRPGYIRPSKRHLFKSLDSDGEKALHEWFSWENENRPMSNFLKISLSRLLHQWHDGPEPANCERNIEANKIMHDIDELMTQLRSCYTLHVVERISITIAARLLELVISPFCRNPFLCIQQAAFFASLGPKGGTADHFFKDRLPMPEVCTSRNALLILGRAACLNSLHFSLEATFLCCYVARICGIYMNDKDVSQKTHKRWRILGCLAYDLSVMIRITARLHLQDFEKRDDAYSSWDRSVIDLFHRFRNEALFNRDRNDINPQGVCVFASTALTPDSVHNPVNDNQDVTFSRRAPFEHCERETGTTTVEMPHLVEV
jgi:hypothetical protein